MPETNETSVMISDDTMAAVNLDISGDDRPGESLLLFSPGSMSTQKPDETAHGATSSVCVPNCKKFARRTH